MHFRTSRRILDFWSSFSFTLSVSGWTRLTLDWHLIEIPQDSENILAHSEFLFRFFYAAHWILANRLPNFNTFFDDCTSKFLVPHLQFQDDSELLILFRYGSKSGWIPWKTRLPDRSFVRTSKNNSFREKLSSREARAPPSLSIHPETANLSQTFLMKVKFILVHNHRRPLVTSSRRHFCRWSLAIKISG